MLFLLPVLKLQPVVLMLSVSDTVKHFLKQVFEMHQSIFVLISGKVLSLLMTVGLSDLEHVRT